MKCPHCLESFFPAFTETWLRWQDGNGPIITAEQRIWKYKATVCPACNRLAVFVLLVHHTDPTVVLRELMVWPKGMARSPLPKEVPEEFAEDYREACNTLADSSKASAALSRRCLQRLLREKAGVKKADLYDEIEEVIGKSALPSDLTEALHHVRVIGNFAAHPEKSKRTGEIVEVEPGEAEWTLDVLESLFDFYFVRPAKLAERKAALNAKLTDAGKKPLKGP
jgi:uncharacterized protein DUF4145